MWAWIIILFKYPLVVIMTIWIFNSFIFSEFNNLYTLDSAIYISAENFPEISNLKSIHYILNFLIDVIFQNPLTVYCLITLLLYKLFLMFSSEKLKNNYKLHDYSIQTKIHADILKKAREKAKFNYLNTTMMEFEIFWKNIFTYELIFLAIISMITSTCTYSLNINFNLIADDSIATTLSALIGFFSSVVIILFTLINNSSYLKYREKTLYKMYKSVFLNRVLTKDDLLYIRSKYLDKVDNQ